MGKIYFQTMAYNAEKTLARCVDSVFNQTKYSENIEYWFCENGSTDRTREMIEEYARNDSRIKLFYNEGNEKWNSQSLVFLDLAVLLKEDDYLCVVDSDDEYKPDFLEKMIPFICQNDLDFAMCGNDFIDSVSGKIMGQRVLPQTLILDSPEKFANYFPIYHQFARTMWGKIFTGKIANQMTTWNNCPAEWWVDLPYGSDTIFTFSALKHSNRVGIFPETFYKYYVSKKSISHMWDPGRFKSDRILNEDAENYLSKFGPISRQNREFLNCVYANALSDSLAVLFNAAGMSAEEKLKELRKAVDYRATSDMMAYVNDDVSRCKRNIFNAVLKFGSELKQENEDFRAALALICPDCAPFVDVNELELYVREGAMQNALFKDNMTELVAQLLSLISKGAYTKQFDLFKIVGKFSADRGLASEVTDVEFIKKHSDIFFLIWQKKYVQALDKMTETLLKKKSWGESFLQIYLTLAAILESVDEFVLGKVKLAAYYCAHGMNEECCAVLDDLADMGVEDNDEITEIRVKLNSK